MSATAGSSIIPRKLKYDWENAPLHWLRDDPKLAGAGGNTG